MFSSALRAALVALVASAVAVSAERGLSLKVSGPEAVDGVDNLKVTTTLVNTGDETLKLLNDPRGPLSTLPANTFDITTDSGASPSFVGVKVRPPPTLTRTFILTRCIRSSTCLARLPRALTSRCLLSSRPASPSL